MIVDSQSMVKGTNVQERIVNMRLGDFDRKSKIEDLNLMLISIEEHA